METKQAVNPVRPEGSRKLVYCTRNAVPTKVQDLWPNIDQEHHDKLVLVGEHYIHDEWFPLRTSLIIEHNAETNTYETLNSIYRVID